MPAARGKKRKGTRIKNEGNSATKKPVLSEDAKTNLSDNCSPELTLDDQKLKQEYVTGTGSMDNTNSCMSGADNASKAVGDTLGSNKNPEDVQDQHMNIPCVETPSNVEKSISHSTLENESIGDKDEDNIKSHTYIIGPGANLDSSPAKLPNNEDEENPLEILNAPSGSKARGLEIEVHSEDIQALACYNDSGDTEPFRASFLSASQPVTSTRISKSLCSKISKGFKPPPTKNDLDIATARQPSEVQKKNENVLAEKEKSNRDNADIRPYIFNTPHHKLSSEVSESDTGSTNINSDKCESDLNLNFKLKERHEGDKTEEVGFHLDNDNISEDGKSRLQLNVEETSNCVAVNLIIEDKSQGPDSQLHFESSTEFENKKLAIPFTEAHVDNDTSKCDDNQSINVSPKRTCKEAKQHFEKADRSYEDSKKLQCGPYSSVHEDDHCSDTVSQSSGIGTQGFVADPSNGSGQGSSEHLGSSGDTNTCRSDNNINNMAFGHPQSARPQTLAVEMFGSPTTKNELGSIDQCTFSPLVGLTDRSCQKQKSPMIKFPSQIEATEAIDSTDCQRARYVVQGYKKDSFDSITKFDEIAMKSLDNKAGLTVKPASVCLEQSLKLTTSESSKIQGQVKSTGNSKEDRDKLGLPITECFHTSNLELDQQKENKTYQHLKNSETGVVSGLPDTDSTTTSTLNKQSPTSTQPFTCSNKNELSTNSSNIAEPFMDRREDINTISSPMRFRDMISEKTQSRDKPKEGKQEDKNKLPREAVATDTFSSNIENRAGNLESIKPEDDSPAPHLNTMMKAITEKKSSDDSCDKMSDVKHKDKLETNCDVSGDSLSMFGKFPFSKQTWSISQPQNDGSQTESSDLGDAKNESKSAIDTEISIKKEKINERQNPTMLTTTSVLNISAELNKTEQASEMACGNMTVDEILDILSVSESRAENIGCENYNTQPTGNEISFTTKTQSYALSETAACPDEQNPVDLEQSLADVLDDIQSTRTDLDFCDDLDAQTLLFDNDDINKGVEPNQEDIEMIDRFENNFQKKQKSAVEQVNMKKVEGASIIKAIMGDLVFTNRQLVKMKKEMDLLSRSLERIGKQQDNTDKGARSIGSW